MVVKAMMQLMPGFTGVSCISLERLQSNFRTIQTAI
jgi:hypothetical protein